MKDIFVSSITILYACAGIVAIAGFLPTLRDLFILRRNSANPATSFIWASTNGIATLYAFFVVKDTLFTILSGVSCCCFLAIFSMSLYLQKK